MNNQSEKQTMEQRLLELPAHKALKQELDYGRFHIYTSRLQEFIRDEIAQAVQEAKREMINDIAMAAALATTSARTEQERWDMVMKELKAKNDELKAFSTQTEEAK